jgi:L-cysteine desulfidase
MDLATFLPTFIREELKPAVGCTEPICVAFTASVAGERFRTQSAPLDRIEVELDKNVFKNGKDVDIPTPVPMRGNLFAAPLGALLAQPGKRLTILQDIDPETCRQAQTMVDQKRVHLGINPEARELFVKVTLSGADGTTVTAITQKRHDRVVFLSHNQDILLDERNQELSTGKGYDVSTIPFAEYYEFCRRYSPAPEIRALFAESIAMNRKVMEAGLAGVGTGFGRKILEIGRQECAMNNMISRCAAAVDARMAGLSLPVMSVTGSGNQGLIIFLTHDIHASAVRPDDDTFHQSLLLSIFLAAKAKHFSGRLSALCGCVVVAASAAAAGLCHMEGMPFEKLENAFNIMVSDIMGILCDGAKSSCALKAATGVNSLLRTVKLAGAGFSIPPLYGIIGRTIDETIINIGKISSQGMVETDQEIVKIMSAK